MTRKVDYPQVFRDGIYEHIITQRVFRTVPIAVTVLLAP